MSEGLLSLRDYERNNIGTWTMAIVNASNCWSDPENVKKLNEMFVTLRSDVAKQLPAVTLLRAIIVTGNVCEEYNRLLSGLETKSRVDVPREGYLAGKVLTWGTCDSPETYFSAIVLDEQICAAVALCNEEEYRATIVHELAHVAEGYFTHGIFMNEKESRDISTHEFDRILLSEAKSIFSEYFAQCVAFSYYTKQETLDAHICHLSEQLTTVSAYLKKEIEKYRYHGDMGILWPIAISELTRVFGQVGRSLGLISRLEGDMYEKCLGKLMGEVEKANPLWEPVVTDFLNALINFEIEKMGKESFDPLTSIIEKGYHASGFVPERMHEGKLYINIPFR